MCPIHSIIQSLCIAHQSMTSVNVRNQLAAHSLAVAGPRRRAVLAFTFLTISVGTFQEHRQSPDKVETGQRVHQTCKATSANTNGSIWLNEYSGTFHPSIRSTVEEQLQFLIDTQHQYLGWLGFTVTFSTIRPHCAFKNYTLFKRLTLVRK